MDHIPEYDTEQKYQRDSLLDFFSSGEFPRKHSAIIRTGKLGERDVRFLNRLLRSFELYGEEEMPMNEADAERFFELADRANSLVSS